MGQGMVGMAEGRVRSAKQKQEDVVKGESINQHDP